MGASHDSTNTTHTPLQQSKTLPHTSTSLQQNIENEEPITNLSCRLNNDFKKQFTASKNIMNSELKKTLILKNNRHKRYQKLIQPPSSQSCPSLNSSDQIMIPIFQAINRIRINIPAFKMIEVDQRQFILMRHTSVLKDYEMLRQIGKGSFGSVYKARERKTNEVRAVKKINKLNLNYDEKLSLINEFQILRKLDHPNIIKLYEMYDEDDYIYVVTELCEGGNLLDHVTESKLMPETDIRDVMAQLLGAVRYLHDHNILHRDIKLENIVLIKKKTPGSTERLEIKLIDFGISLDLTKHPETTTSSPIGTLLYMSPESLNHEINLASDIYSCGIVLYIMATKRIPFIYSSQAELMNKIEHGDIIRKNMSKLTLDLKLFLVRLLQKNYKKRLSAVIAIDNLWLTKIQNSSSITQTKRVKVAQQMLAYDAKNNLISLIETFLVCKMINQQERQRLANLFEAIDSDKSGVIEIEQFKKFYYQNSEHYDSSEIQELAGILDKNKSGNIDFNQFIAAMYSRRKLFQLQSLQVAFDFLDKDFSGEISKKQLEEILKGVQHEEIEYLFKQLDKNHDCYICKTEFLDYFKRYL